eukprot:TRINITY_DN2341_c0_g1_i1.p1 TRINITY_DN2341_c0_g1~~TRINITY_DN2341_c0_g1_i1.p1  ORF type:complete len:501 (+),score=104.56 TRINITY_DN2341_c0_g1_i1:157-1503(+)
MFLSNHYLRTPDDLESQRIKLATKLTYEFGAVRDLAPVAGAPGGASVSAADLKNALDEVTAASQGTSSFDQLLQSLPAPAKTDEANNSQLIEFRAKPPGAAAAADNQTRAVVAREAINVPKPQWHAPWKMMRVVSGHLGWVRSVAVDPTNEWFATGAADRTIKVWDLASGTLKLTLTGHINAVRGLAVSDRHPYLFSCGEDKMVRCWDLEQNKVVRHYHGHLSGVYCMALHPTLDILITGGRDSTARVWDIRTKTQVHVLGGHQGTVDAVKTQSTDPQVITGSMDATVRLWDLAAGKTLTTLTNHKKAVRTLAVHPTEHTFLSGAPDNLKKWKLPEGKFLLNFSGHNAIINTVSLNATGVAVSGSDNGGLAFWDYKTGHMFQRAETIVQPGSLESEAGIYCSTFDQTGSRLICGEADKTVKIWKEDPDATPETHPGIPFVPALQAKRY